MRNAGRSSRSLEEALEGALFIGVEGFAPDAVAAGAGGLGGSALGGLGGILGGVVLAVLELQEIARERA